MKSWYYLISLGLLFLFPVTVVAVPAYPGLVKMKQPDGKEISIYMRGDEKVRWMESPDGYSLLYDSDKQIVFATTNEAGNMVPSSIVFQDESLRSSAINEQLANIPKNLSYSTSQINTLREIWNMTNSSIGKASKAATGTIRAVCTLVQFPDKPLEKTTADFEQLLNQSGYSLDGARGSVRDFYYENSYGEMELVITVVGPYTAVKNYDYYGENNSAGYDMYAYELARDVANYTFTQSSITPADFDNDNDGFIDAFHFIYAGYGEEAGGGANAIWAHKSGFFPLITFGGKRLDSYSCSPELRSNSGSGITRVGVICHEMGHIFGSPDFYDVNGEEGGSFDGTGSWDLMAGGSWNGPSRDGASPAHINMYQKIRMGWVDPVTLSIPQPIDNMLNSAEHAVAYRYDTPVSGEYYVLENRQRKGFDAYVPGTGLLIYRISVTNGDISSQQVNTTHPQKVYPVCASSTYKIPNENPISYGNINSAGCPFPGTTRNGSFTDFTTPSAITWNGTNSAKPITEITESGEMISFKFMQPGAGSVNNFTVTRIGTDVQLKWDKPGIDILGYNIYRNDRLVIRLMGANTTSYTEYNVSPGHHTYCVSAFYDQEESVRSCQNITIEGNPNEYLPIKNLQAETGGNTVELTWDSPLGSDWMFLTDEYSDGAVYIPGVDNFSAVVRFTEDDLKYFVGSQLSQVRFYLYNADCKHTIQIWHLSNPLSTITKTPLISQPVENKATGVTIVDLNTPLTIEEGKELWIGINYEMNPMAGVARVDNGPQVPDKNLILYEDGWAYLSNDFNWYIAGYLQLDDNGAVGIKYAVYRNNVWLNDVTTELYRDEVVPPGSHIYCVSAVYGDRRTERSEQVCVQASTGTGIVKINLSEEVKVYPNPLRRGDVLTMDVGNDFVDAKLSLYSVSGQLLRTAIVSEPVYRQTINLAPGIYILQIRKDTQVINRKIVVN